MTPALHSFDWMNPVLLAAVVSVITVLGAKILDVYIASRKSRSEFRNTDRELLSADEKDFRLTIIKQLQQCHDEGLAKDKELLRYQQENIKLSSRVDQLEWEIDRLKQRVGSAVDAAVETSIESVRHAADVVTEIVSPGKVKK